MSERLFQLYKCLRALSVGIMALFASNLTLTHFVWQEIRPLTDWTSLFSLRIITLTWSVLKSPKFCSFVREISYREGLSLKKGSIRVSLRWLARNLSDLFNSALISSSCSWLLLEKIKFSTRTNQENKAKWEVIRLTTLFNISFAVANLITRLIHAKYIRYTFWLF